MDYFKLTSLFKEMRLLEHVSKNPKTTQTAIAEKIEAAPSMVNSYIKQLEEKGYLKRIYKSVKVVDYKITPKGIRRKNFLQINYMRELVDLYREGQQSVTHFLESIEQKGLKVILLYGAGEVAEIMLDICQQQGFELKVVGIIDDDPEKIGKKVKGIPIYSKDDIDDVGHDGIVITSYTFEKEILNKLKEINYSRNKTVKYFEV